MAEVFEQGELGASADEVWKLISDFGGFVEAMGLPVELAGEGIGQTRTIPLGSEPVTERLDSLDADAKRMSYSLVSGGGPVTNYLSTMQLVSTADGRTRVDWNGTFDSKAPATEEEAVSWITQIYRGGIAGLQARFGA